MSPDGVCHLLQLFYDPFKLRVQSEFELNAPIPTSIRLLTLDHNQVGRTGADALAQVVQTSRQLKYLSLRHCGLVGPDIQRLCLSLGSNSHLIALRLASNHLGDQGMDYLTEALRTNRALTHLDLFDVHLTNQGARFLELALRANPTTLKSLRLANTKINVE